MNVLLIDQFGERGGAQQGVLDAAQAIAARGGKVVAAAPRGPALDALARVCQDAIEIECGPFQSRRKTATDAWRMVRQLPALTRTVSKASADVDIVYVHGPRVALAAALGNRSRAMVFHAHSIVEQAAARATLARALRSYDALFACSHFAGDWLNKLDGQRVARVIYNGVSLSHCVSKGSAVIGVLGRIAPEKGQLEFVRAARRALARDSRLRFAVAGTPMFAPGDYDRRVRAEAGECVEFHGWVEPNCFLAQIGLLVVPSSYVDACPRVVLEAFAAGVPVLASRAGGIPELIEHGRTGLLVDSLAPEILSEAILEAIREPARLHEIQIRARAVYSERFTVERYQSEVVEALEDVLARTVANKARR